MRGERDEQMMVASVSSMGRRRGRPREVSPAALARRVMASWADIAARTGQSDPAVFPSERDLATQLGVSRHAVRSSMEYLQAQGAIRKLPGRGTVVMTADAPSTLAHPAIRCINFLQGSAIKHASLQWLNQEYLAAYTQVLDVHHLKTRFVDCPDGLADYESLFWNQAPRSQQVCLLMGMRPPGLLAWLNEHRVPYVVQNYAAYGLAGLPPHRRVFVNKVNGIFEATRHLLAMGHRRIGFIGKRPGPAVGLTPEYDGWSMAMRCAAVSPDERDIQHLVYEEVEPCLDACRRMLDRPDRPTAIITSHGGPLAALQQVAGELGLHVPGDVSLIGFSSFATYGKAGLSTIEVPRRQLARQSLELLLRVAQEPWTEPKQEDHVLECELRLEHSIAPPSVE